MDGMEGRGSVFVIAATNRPELIDPAMLRPGRLDKLLYVPLPSPEDRIDILKSLVKNVALDANVDLIAIGQDERASGFSGADLAALVREAGIAVLRELKCMERKPKKKDSLIDEGTSGMSDFTEDDNATKTNENTYSQDNLRIEKRHFDQAFLTVLPSVSKEDQKSYEQMKSNISKSRARVNKNG